MNYPIPKAPLAEAIAEIVGKMPPFEMDGIWWLDDLPNKIADDLGEWCCYNIESQQYIGWATGSGVIDAAELLLKTAIDNANLRPNFD